MKEPSDAARTGSGDEETRFLVDVLGKPDRLRERLVLAIALAPPKAKRRRGRRRLDLPRRR